MIQSLPSSDGPLVTVILATLAIGMPIVFALLIRFLLDRNLNLGRSKELEKLIWQLHRIASVMEQQMKQPVAPPPVTKQDIAASPAVSAPAAPATPATNPVRLEQPEASQASAPQTALQETSADGERHGVNSMFGL